VCREFAGLLVLIDERHRRTADADTVLTNPEPIAVKNRFRSVNRTCQPAMLMKTPARTAMANNSS
jgi:hypothetical protein